MIKILAGGPAVDSDAAYFKAHAATLEHQKLTMDPDKVRVDILHLDGHNPDVEYKVEGGHHKWSEEAFDWMGHLRQSFLDRAVKHGYDAVFRCDTDLLLGDGVLQALMACPSPITYGVFWTKWEHSQGEQAQVWDMHPGEWAPGSKAQSILLRGGTTEVLGGGACSLIWAAAIRRGARYYPRLQSLPHHKLWRGEDRTFSLTAEVHGLTQSAIGGLPITHLYSEMSRSNRSVERNMKKLFPGYTQDS